MLWLLSLLIHIHVLYYEFDMDYKVNQILMNLWGNYPFNMPNIG